MTDKIESIPEEIYRSSDRWHLSHFPPIDNKRNHTILFEYPISNDQSKPPEPRIGKKKWDLNHVRLPCATQNEFKVESSSDSTECVTKKRWEVIQSAFSKDIRSTQELEQAILTYNPEYTKIWNFEPLHTLFDHYLDKSETELFFKQTLPNIISLALRLPDILPSAIPLLKHGQNKSISMSQKQIACLLANAFLCTFPGRSGIYQSPAEFLTYPSINFSSLFQTFGNASLQKIRCICNYFRRICSKMPCGVVTFSRRSIPHEKFPKWRKCHENFKNSLLHVCKDGTIENDGDGLLQVDFANNYLGGGILVGGCVQEEIRFSICPELICSRLFTECLTENESVTIMGFERFSDYKGYGPSFEWAGDYFDETPLDSFRRRKCTLVAIDAMPFPKGGAPQYREYMLKRELNKAFVGFKHELSTPAPGIATGNWGCGAFNGDKRLKSILQLIACVVNDRPLVYFTFGNNKFRDELITFHKFLSESKITIAELWALLNRYAESKSKGDLYEFITGSYQDSMREKMQSKSLSKFDQFCSMFKRAGNVPKPKTTDTDKAKDDTNNDDEPVNDDLKKLSGNRNLPTKQSDSLEHSSSSHDEMVASCSNEFKLD